MRALFVSIVALSAPALAHAQHLDASKVSVIHPKSGVDMQELLGQGAALNSARQSIARFSIAPGTDYPESYNRASEEIFIVIAGRGTVWLDGKAQSLNTGDLVKIAPGVRHKVRADANVALSFYAISAPPFRPDDYVQTH